MRHKWHIAAVLVAFALVAASCGDDDEPAPAPPVTPSPTTAAPGTAPPTQPPATTPDTPPPTTAPGIVITGELARADVPYATTTTATESDVAAIVAGNTEFALDLLRLAASDGTNLIVSPFSIAAALTMTYAGARGVTAQQMRDVLHLGLSDAAAHEARNELSLRISDVPALPPADERTPMQVNIANSLWGQQGFAFGREFLETLASAYDAGVRLVDFVADADGARLDINDWVAEQTNDRIEDLLPPGSVSVDTRLVLTNAIWFKANWAAQFNPDDTKPEAFHLLDGSEVTVQMMDGGGRMGFMRGDGFKAARLGYVGDASMLVIAPDSGRFDEILAALDGAFLTAVDGELSTHALTLLMPRFEFETELSLQSILTQLGMSEAFDPMAADFSGISTQRDDLHIQDVLHKAFISVDEQGTEAAAATAVVIGVTSAPPPATLTLDNPFIFLIRHDSTGEILFAGAVTNPG